MTSHSERSPFARETDDDMAPIEVVGVPRQSQRTQKRVFVFVLTGIAFVVIGVLAIVLFINIGGASKDDGTDNPTNAPSGGVFRPSVLLISIDGFRADYWSRYVSPTSTLNKMATNGVRAIMKPVFPTKTFVNHYSIVTGLLPESHGIVDNTMWDPVFNANFSLSLPSAVSDGRWYGGEPIWVTTVKQNQKSATLFWPGSEANISNYRPSYWLPYNQSMPYDLRVNQVLQWMKMPYEERPSFLTVYFENVDNAGHSYGPDSQQVADAISYLDGFLTTLYSSIQSMEIASFLDIIITSDHGMSQMSNDRRIILSNYINLTDVWIVSQSPNCQIYPAPGRENDVFNALNGAHPNMQVFWRETIPAEYRFRDNRRITTIYATADDGWTILKTAGNIPIQGNHGFNNSVDSMQALFLATGPSFRTNYTAPESVLNLNVYSLMCKILNVTAAPNNGSIDSMLQFLKQ